ncbi:hypothetical protein X975_06755, partial [Stegodyphus mimosarum]
MVELKNYQTTFTFHSDSANTRPGFVIKVEQEECQDTTKVEPPVQKLEFPHQKGVAHFEPPVAEPPLDETYLFPPPPLDYEHLIDYPIYEATALQRTLQVTNQNCDRIFQR